MAHTKNNIEKKWSFGVTACEHKIQAIFVERRFKKVIKKIQRKNQQNNNHVWCSFVGSKPIVIISDIRRQTDVKFFKESSFNCRTVRINASEETRQKRGWKFEDGVDNVQSECDLDDFDEWDLVIDNDGVMGPNEQIDRIIELIQSNN